MTQQLLTEYQARCNAASDINEHLPTLKKYAEQCSTITEMGVRSIVSTYAFIAAKPQKLTCIDIKHPDEQAGHVGTLQKAQTIAEENGVDFKFIQGSTLELEIETTELLFIDTWHTYNQLRCELEKHAKNVTKYIILHDTVTYGHRDEGGGDKGLWPAVEEFLNQNTCWEILEKFENNNGLTILTKKV